MSSPPPPSILVLGAGELGLSVLRSLATHPLLTPSPSPSHSHPQTKISVLLRPSTITSTDPSISSRNSLLQSLSISLVPGDVILDSESSLSSTFRNFHTVLSCTGMTSGPEVQLRIARAALAAKVQRYFPWQFGIDYDAVGRTSAQDLFDGQLDVRDLLRGQSGTKWVIVSTGMFISFLFEPGFGIVDEERRKVTGIGGWDREITVTGPEDIGKLTAEIALGCTEIEGVVYVAGDTISMGRLADVVEKTMGREVERVVKSVKELKGELERDPENNMKKYRVVFAEAEGVAWSKEKSFNGVRGIPTETVEQWAEKNLR